MGILLDAGDADWATVLIAVVIAGGNICNRICRFELALEGSFNVDEVNYGVSGEGGGFGEHVSGTVWP